MLPNTSETYKMEKKTFVPSKKLMNFQNLTVHIITIFLIQGCERHCSAEMRFLK